MSDFNPYDPSHVPPQKKFDPTPDQRYYRPKNYLTEAILLLVCCGGILAVPAIVYAAQVDSKFNAGDYRGAQESSDNAKKWCIIALSFGLICGGLYFVVNVLVIMADGGM